LEENDANRQRREMFFGFRDKFGKIVVDCLGATSVAVVDT